MLIFSITEWWSNLEATAQIFWGIAIIFTVFFIIQFVISLFGLDFDSDVDIDIDIDVDADSSGGFSLDPSFTLLSVRSIIAFFTFFGWAGVLALSRGFGTSTVLIFASVSGLAAMLLVAYLMYFFSQLTEEGNADLRELIYQDGTVYLPIPGRRKGKGKVHVTLNESLREMDAVTEGEALPNGKAVKVVEIIDKDTLVVEPVEIFEAQAS
ncbi:MAG: hypothetical protein OEQ53_02345 [Saprospiraceae bacterium]|nr:hypothetical protein [Saprospiraceae bacterium]